jgi:hypothetical protein
VTASASGPAMSTTSTSVTRSSAPTVTKSKSTISQKKPLTWAQRLKQSKNYRELARAHNSAIGDDGKLKKQPSKK